ncbi:putative prephenate dehydrogenase [NADP(+)] [Podosphaera aphanis]|nr:putative prephenate dehydrogenase [NADP(+)] [Podosphaera aphanis]
MGDMGRMYAQRLSASGWRINACDREENYERLLEAYADNAKIKVFRNGHYVSRASDYIIYSVEAASIDSIVSQYGPSTKLGAIVGGQTSCKAPEIEAFERHLPEDVDIVSCHSLHGPKIDPKGQPLVLIKHRASQENFDQVERVLSCLKSTHVYLSAAEHDRITADTQAVTHAAFLSMGKAWHANEQFPWETARYVGGIENVKINLTLRIYSQKWHVYAGLAILNPYAKEQIRQYAQSVTSLFKLMLGGHRKELEERIKSAGSFVFGGQKWEGEPLIDDDVLNRFSLGKKAETPLPNNHLSLLAMVDCWSQLKIVPYDHMICSTPLFRLWLGVTECLFRKPELLDEVLRIAIDDNTFRSDDLEFTFAARGWSECVRFGDFASYRDRFESTQKFFEDRYEDATRVGNEMMKTILANSKK